MGWDTGSDSIEDANVDILSARVALECTLSEKNTSSISRFHFNKLVANLLQDIEGPHFMTRVPRNFGMVPRIPRRGRFRRGFYLDEPEILERGHWALNEDGRIQQSPYHKDATEQLRWDHRQIVQDAVRVYNTLNVVELNVLASCRDVTDTTRCACWEEQKWHAQQTAFFEKIEHKLQQMPERGPYPHASELDTAMGELYTIADQIEKKMSFNVGALADEGPNIAKITKKLQRHDQIKDWPITRSILKSLEMVPSANVRSIKKRANNILELSDLIWHVLSYTKLVERNRRFVFPPYGAEGSIGEQLSFPEWKGELSKVGVLKRLGRLVRVLRLESGQLRQSADEVMSTTTKTSLTDFLRQVTIARGKLSTEMNNDPERLTEREDDDNTPLASIPLTRFYYEA